MTRQHARERGRERERERAHWVGLVGGREQEGSCAGVRAGSLSSAALSGATSQYALPACPAGLPACLSYGPPWGCYARSSRSPGARVILSLMNGTDGWMPWMRYIGIGWKNLTEADRQTDTYRCHTSHRKANANKRSLCLYLSVWLQAPSPLSSRRLSCSCLAGILSYLSLAGQHGREGERRRGREGGRGSIAMWEKHHGRNRQTDR